MRDSSVFPRIRATLFKCEISDHSSFAASFRMNRSGNTDGGTLLREAKGSTTWRPTRNFLLRGVEVVAFSDLEEQVG